LEEIRKIENETTDLKALSPQVLETLQLIETQIVIPPEDAATTTSPKTVDRFSADRRMSMNPRRRVPSRPVAATPFQVTKRVEVGTLDKQFNDIRSMLNKLSSKNVELQKPLVLDAIAKFLFQIEEDENVKNQHVRKMTEILISNPFLVTVYTEIYAELCAEEFPYHTDFVNIVQDTLLKEYMTSLRELHAISSEEDDYDAFCEYNKRNDKRKAWATFFAQAAKQSIVVSRTEIQTMIRELLDLVHRTLVTENKTREVEEWTENIAVLLASSTADSSIQSLIQSLTEKKPKDYPSWSSRALFKYMDLVKYIAE
jgi:hypothetical protein